MAVSRPATLIAENVPAGIVYMVVTTLFFVGLDTLAKLAMQDFPTIMVVWARFTFHMIFITAMLSLKLPTYIRSRALKLQLARSALMLLTNGLFFAGLRFTPIATATSIAFLGPIIVTLLSVPLLGESVGIRRWTGVIIGFIGALIIIRPGTDAMGAGALLFLGSATSHALYQIITRQIRSRDDPLTTLFYTALVGCAVTSVMLPTQWQTPEPMDWLLLASLGATGAIGHFFLIKSLQAAPAAAVVPFSYTSLAWAIIFGYAFFSEWPDLWTLAGAAIIASSGIYIFYREQKLKKLGLRA